jgi:DNA-binding transcriptional LysR family regulator
MRDDLRLWTAKRVKAEDLLQHASAGFQRFASGFDVDLARHRTNPGMSLSIGAPVTFAPRAVGRAASH